MKALRILTLLSMATLIALKGSGQTLWVPATPSLGTPGALTIPVNYGIDRVGTVYIIVDNFNNSTVYTSAEIKAAAQAGPSGTRVAAVVRPVIAGDVNAILQEIISVADAGTFHTINLVAEDVNSVLQAAPVRLTTTTLICSTINILWNLAQPVVCINKGAIGTYNLVADPDPQISGIYKGTQWAISWGDGTINNYTSVSDNDLPPVAARTHTYSTATNCNYVFQSSITNPCGQTIIHEYVAVVHGRDIPTDGDGVLRIVDNSNGNPMIQVCEGTQSVITLRDNSIWNCQNPVVPGGLTPVPNSDPRNIEWLYGVDLDKLTPRNTITGAVNIATMGSAPVFSGRILAPNYSTLSQSITIPATAKAGEYFRVYLKNWNKCNWPDAEFVSTYIDIQVIASPPPPVAPNKTICFGDDRTLSVTSVPVGTINWFADASLTIQVFTGTTYTPANPNIGTYNFWVTDRSTVGELCMSPATIVNLTIFPVIATNNIAPAQTICYNTVPAVLSGTLPTGGNGTYIYLWESSTISSTGPWSAASGTNNTQNYIPGPLTQTTWFRRRVNSGPCSLFSPALQIIVNPLLTITTPGNLNAICHSPVLQNASMFYSASTGNPISYMIDWNAAANTAGLADQGITVFPFAPGGGVINNIAISPNTPAGFYAGTMIITNPIGCPNTYPVSVLVNPVAELNNKDTVVCSGDTFYNGPANLNSGYAPLGTTYSWPAPAVTGGITGGVPGSGMYVIGTLNNPTNVVQTAIYTITPVSGSCTGAPLTLTVSVEPRPLISNLMSTICSGSPFFLIPVNGTNGIVPAGTTYSWPAPVVTGGITGGAPGFSTMNISGTLINPTNSPQTATYTVMPRSGICTGPSFLVVVTVMPTPLITHFVTTVNSGTMFVITPVNVTNGIVPAGTTYTWLVPAMTGGITGGIAGSGPSISGTLTNTTNTIQTATYTVMPTSGPCAGPAFTVTVAVNPAGQVNDPVDQVVCNGTLTTTVNFTTINTGGTTFYTWTNDNTGIGLAASGTGDILSFNAVNPGTSPLVATITVTPHFTDGSLTTDGPPETFTITVNPTAQVNDPPDQVVCNGSVIMPIIFSTINTGGIATYSWTNSNPDIGLAPAGTGNIGSFTAINVGTAPVVATITVNPTFTNGLATCNGPVQTFIIIVNPTGLVNNPGNQTVCNGATITAINFTTNNIAGTTTYDWINNSPGIGLSASGTGDIAPFTAINTGTVPVEATITVTPRFTNSSVTCDGPAQTFTITVNPTPVTTPITGPTIICEDATNKVYTTTNNPGSTYNWTIPASMSFSFNNDLYFIIVNAIPGMAAPGDKITVVETSIAGCSGVNLELGVTVAPLPVPAISGPSSAGVNSTGNIYTTEAGMTNYTWNVSPGGTITAGGTVADNTCTVTWNVSGQQTVSVNYTNPNNCSALNPTIFNVSVGSPLNGTSVTTNVLCFGSNTGSATVSGFGGVPPYEYSLNAGPYQLSGTFNLLPAGIFTITVRDATLSTSDIPAIITEPASALSGSIINQVNVSIFGGNDGQVTIAGSGGTPVYLYKLDAGSYQPAGTFNNLSAGSYTIVVQDANLCTVSIPVIITQPSSLLPVLNTLGISSITTTTASGGGNITSEGGSVITARGICWSISAGPTTTDSKTSDGTGTGVFTSSLTGLTPNTKYYVRAYATNSSGTAYGEEKQFQTAHSDPGECLVYWYPFNGNANAAPGLGIDGTVNGALLSEDRFGTANSSYYFNGTDNSITIPGTLPITNVFTISFWAYSERESGYGNILTDGGINYGGNDFLINFRGNDIGIRGDKGGSPLNYEYSGPPEILNLNLVRRWVHVAWVMNPAGSIIYLDGVRIAEINIPGTNEGYHDDHVTIGARHVWTNMDYFYLGKLDDIRIYNCDLTATEIYGIFTEQGSLLPTVNTNAVTDITASTATSGGNIISDGGSPVIARGICWNTSANPTLSDNFTMDGTGSGAFTSIITGLVNGTTYYVRSYATNSTGTAYGNEISFTPNTFANCGTVTDVDGNVYNTVTIGSQCWMQDNLKTTRYRDGSSIPQVTDNTAWANLTTPGYSWYNNDESTYKNTNGGLYNWYAANRSDLCPTGWHTPADLDWTTLTDFLGGEIVAGGKLKEAGIAHWDSPNTGATNESGFTALPFGIRQSGGIFSSSGPSSVWWSSSENGPSTAWARSLYYDYATIIRFGAGGKTNGMYIRCIQGEGIVPPTLTATTAITSITAHSATSGGNISSDGGSPVIARGVCWSTSANPTVAGNKSSDGTGTGAFTSMLTGMIPGTVYYVRAYATNSAGTAYGYEQSFMTSIPSSTLTGSGDGCAGSASYLRSVITGGKPPYTINYTKNGVPQIPVTNYISDSNFNLGILPAGTYTFAITSIIDADSYSFTAGALPPAYTINIYDIPDAGTTINNSPFICSNETTNIVFHSNVPNSDFTYTVTYSPATAWESGKAPVPGIQFNGEGVTLAQNLAHSSGEPVTVTYTITAQEPGATACTGPASIVVVAVSPAGQVNQPANQTVCDGTFVPAISFTTTNSGVQTYFWTNNNTSIGLAAWGFGDTEIPSFTAVNTGTTPVTASLTVTPIFIGGGSCIGQPKTFTITVNPKPTLSGTLTPPPICSNTVFSYTPASALPGTTFAWSRPLIIGISNFAASGTGNPNETLVNTTTDPVPVVYTYNMMANGCSNIQNVTVIVNPTPALTSTLTPPSICSNTIFSYVPTSNTPGTIFNWTRPPVPGITPAGLVSGTGNPNELLVNNTSSPVAVTYVYTLIANGCTNVRNVVVTVNPIPALTSTLTPPAICSNSVFTYTPASATPGTIFNWSRPVIPGITPAGPASGANNPNELLINNTPNPVPVVYTYTLMANGCSNTQNVTVTVNPKPVLSSTLIPSSICSNTPFTYIPTSLTAGTIFAWSRPAVPGIIPAVPASGTGNPNELLVNTTGTPLVVTYVYTLIANGCINVQNVPVTVNPKADVTTANSATICSGAATNIALSSNVAGANFNWTIGPVTGGITGAAASGGSVINQVLVNPVNTPGTVTYIVTPIANFCPGTPKNIIVTVNPTPNVTSVSPTIICTGTATNIALNSNVPGATFNWSIGPVTGGITGATAGSGLSINQTLNNPGYTPGTVTYRVTPTANACSGIPIDITVTVNPRPDVSTLSPAIICTGTATNIVLNSNVAGATFTWTIGPVTGGITGAAASGGSVINQVLVNPVNTPGTVTYIVTPIANSCPGTPANIIVTVNPAPDVTTVSPTAVCTGAPASIVLNSNVPGATFTWTIGSVTGGITGASAGSGSSINQTLINPGSAPGTVTYRVTPEAGSCIGTPVDITVTVNPLTGVTAFSSGATVVCQNSADELYIATTLNSTSILYSVSPLSAGVINQTSGLMDWDAAFSGTATINATSTGLCGTTSADRVVTVNPSTGPVIFTAGATAVCQDAPDETFTAIALYSTSISYSVSPASAGIINTVTGVMDWDAAFAGTATITATSTGLCGTTTADRVVEVNSVPLMVITDPAPVCSPGTADITASSVTSGSTAGLTFTYWTDAGATIVYPTPASATEGTYYIKGTSAPGCFDIKPVVVTVQPKPLAAAGGSTTICATESVTISGASASNGTIFWTTSGKGFLSDASTLTPTYTSALTDAGTTVTLTMTVTSNNACFPQSVTAIYLIFVKQFQAITFTALPEKTYGDNSFTLSAAASSSLSVTYTSSNNSIASISGNNLTITGAGNAIIYANQPGDASYCPAPEVTQVLNVKPRDITITVNPLQSKSYGSSDPVLSYTCNPPLVNGDKFTGSLTRTAGENAGTYSIQQGSISAGVNYSIVSFIPSYFIINKAELTVSGGTAERRYLEPNPALTISYSGFVNGENKSVLDVLPTAATVADTDSDAGSYSITVSGGSDNNYSFKFVNGVLNVLKADQYIIFNDIPDKLRKTEQYQLEAIASSGLPVSFESDDLKKGIIEGSTLIVLKEGHNVIIARQDGNQNWNPAPMVTKTYVGQPTFDNVTSMFTPNGDGVNDYWYIPDIEEYGTIQVKVYNRFGKLVYESQYYKNDWNGNFNSAPLPSASYYYVIKSSEKGIINGVVNIVR